jgi:hypothetical protein
MRFLTKILWLIAFLAATFCWMVLFEHGFSVKSFREGARTELGKLSSLLSGALPQPDADPATALPPAAGDDQEPAPAPKSAP